MRHTTFKYSRCFRKENDPVVRNGQAITPAQMEDFVRRGIPVSQYNLAAMEVDVTSDKDYAVDPDYLKHSSLVSVYEAKRDSEKKAKRALNELRNTAGHE